MVANYFGFAFALVLLLLLGFTGLQWLHIPSGSFVDWAMAIATFGWLLVIITVPWNIHFEAREALAEAALSRENGITVDPHQVTYIQVVQRRSLWIAIALHIVSAASLYALAAAGISQVGYLGSGAALLLTVLRPAIRTYGYFAARIAMLREQFKYPRQDVLELRDRVAQLENVTRSLETQLDVNDSASWVSGQQRDLEALRQDLSRLAANQETLRTTNQAEHDRLSREARQAISQLTTDGQVLEHVREIIRFFKTA